MLYQTQPAGAMKPPSTGLKDEYINHVINFKEGFCHKACYLQSGGIIPACPLRTIQPVLLYVDFIILYVSQLPDEGDIMKVAVGIIVVMSVREKMYN